MEILLTIGNLAFPYPKTVLGWPLEVSGYKNGSDQRAGSLKIYDYDSITSTWSQLGSTILGVTDILV